MLEPQNTITQNTPQLSHAPLRDRGRLRSLRVRPARSRISFLKGLSISKISVAVLREFRAVVASSTFDCGKSVALACIAQEECASKRQHITRVPAAV
jgi:hypothetical protein